MSEALDTPPPEHQAPADVPIRVHEKPIADRLAVLMSCPYTVTRSELLDITQLVSGLGLRVVEAVEDNGSYDVGRLITFIDLLQQVKYASLEFANPLAKAESYAHPLADKQIDNLIQLLKECNFKDNSDFMVVVSVAISKFAANLARIVGALPGYNRWRLIHLLYGLQTAKGIVADAINPHLKPPKFLNL